MPDITEINLELENWRIIDLYIAGKCNGKKVICRIDHLNYCEKVLYLHGKKYTLGEAKTYLEDIKLKEIFEPKSKKTSIWVLYFKKLKKIKSYILNLLI